MKKSCKLGDFVVKSVKQLLIVKKWARLGERLLVGGRKEIELKMDRERIFTV